MGKISRQQTAKRKKEKEKLNALAEAREDKDNSVARQGRDTASCMLCSLLNICD